MGYTTVFQGHFDLTPSLNDAQITYLTQFAHIRHMVRDSSLCRDKPDPIRQAVNLDVGVDGEFFVNTKGAFGQDRDETIIDYNMHPKTQPGLWCQWVPSKDGTKMEWDRGEKFYCSQDWIEYIIRNFLDPWGINITGRVAFAGEDPSDKGFLEIVADGGPVVRSKLVYDATIDAEKLWDSWA